jgi:hypothetical protein
VVLDELGYLALPEGAAELVFQVISERNERASLIVTTNLPFGEWTKVFPDPRLAKAVVDRITHRAHIIETGSESWRFRHGLQRKQKGADRCRSDPERLLRLAPVLPHQEARFRVATAAAPRQRQPTRTAAAPCLSFLIVARSYGSTPPDRGLAREPQDRCR